MCFPVIAAVAAIGQAVMGYAGAQAQADAQNAAYQANVEAANKAAIASYESQNIKRGQIQHNADLEAFNQSIAALEKRSTARVAAGEAGVAGNSIDSYVNSIFAQEGRRYEGLQANYQADMANVTAESKQTEAQAQQRINSVRQAADASPLPFILQGISGAVGAFTAPRNMTVNTA